MGICSKKLVNAVLYILVVHAGYMLQDWLQNILV